MKITIQIKCENIEDFKHHLNTLHNQIEVKQFSLKLHPFHAFKDGLGLSSTEIHSTHEVTIIPK